MAERKTGTVTSFETLSPILALFRLMPEDGSSFPDYKAGQYIALRREDCSLTKRVVGDDGRPHYLPDVDESGKPRRGPVAHSYSISSAPCETRDRGFLEFYVVLEKAENQYPGRLTESLFRLDPAGDNKVGYVNRIVGDFTLEKRAAGFGNVIMVGTGTGLAPFASMIKQLHADAKAGRSDGIRYTLLHANRTFEELAYHRELQEIETAALVDFVYLASISRPSARDLQDPRLGSGRANNVLRLMLGMPLKEQEELDAAEREGGDVARARAVLEAAVRPSLPKQLSLETLRPRFEAAASVILTCGNPSSMSDIKHIADTSGIRYEKEDWKLVLPAKG